MLSDFEMKRVTNCSRFPRNCKLRKLWINDEFDDHNYAIIPGRDNFCHSVIDVIQYIAGVIICTICVGVLRQPSQ